MADLRLSVVRTEDEMRQVLLVRRRVFIEEQRVPEALEVDAYDSHPTATDAVHVLGSLAGAPIASGRLLLDAAPGHSPHLGRVAVLPEHRGRGYGRSVMAFLHDIARERGFAGISLAAQLHAIGFYERLGYRVHGDVFLDAGIEHRWADIEL